MGTKDTSTMDNNNSKPHIAFIGLGNMGAPMAENLLKAGYTLSVFDLSEVATQRLAQAGASVAKSPKERRFY